MALPERLAILETACDRSPMMEGTDAKRIRASLAWLREKDAEPGFTPDEERQIATSLLSVTQAYPRTQAAFEVSQTLSWLQLPEPRPSVTLGSGYRGRLTLAGRRAHL